jgi:beta-lactam-binding protein with PASTA domain
MADRLPSFLPRVAALVLVALAATAGLTYAAGSKLGSTPAVPTGTVAPTPPLVVPDVRNQAFVFAKGTLQDAGFAWLVKGSVSGYPANVVVSQSPAAGSRVVDDGSPRVTLTLRRNSSYAQAGEAADKSPYPATAAQPADAGGNPLGPVASAKATPAKAVKTIQAAAPATAKPATPAKTATTTASTTTTAPATPTKTVASAGSAKPAAAKWPQSRPVAFVVPGARKEPLDEMPLTDRATQLGTWLDAHKAMTTDNAKYWLYQNAWIVTGAQFGWWHGADALKTLIAVDRRTQTLWGIGAQSATAAELALRQVQAKAKP